MSKITIKKIQSFKNKKSFCAITAYDFSTAKIVDEAGIPLVLVGDSAAMVAYGYDTTIPISMGEMLLVTKAVSRAIKSALVVGDMPFLSYQTSLEDAVKNAGRFLKEGGVSAIKLEGGEVVAKHIYQIVRFGIPVMGHVGLTPQSVNQFSGYAVQGKDLLSAQKVLDDARAVEDAGAFSVVLECVPRELAGKITQTLSIPTIGIGSGPYCDGQIQVFHDIMGLVKNFTPKHAGVYANLNKEISTALKKYAKDVFKKNFPEKKHSSSCKSNIIDKLQ